MVTKAQAKATRKYDDKNYDKILLRIRKDSEINKEILSGIAEQRNTSINNLIIEALKEYIKGIWKGSLFYFFNMKRKYYNRTKTNLFNTKLNYIYIP